MDSPFSTQRCGFSAWSSPSCSRLSGIMGNAGGYLLSSRNPPTDRDHCHLEETRHRNPLNGAPDTNAVSDGRFATVKKSECDEA